MGADYNEQTGSNCEPGIGDISADPMFVDAANSDYHLQYNSPCIDAGTNVPEFPDYDFEGDLRILDGDNDGTAVVDMGADEYVIIYCKLTIETSTGGSTAPSPGVYSHPEGTDVTVDAIPDDNYRFSEWTGDVPTGHENDNPVTITIDSNKSITANFAAISTADGDSGKKGGCFIATAAYGTSLHAHLDILRDFRDKYLMASKLGSKLVKLYYKYSPFVAEFITKHKALRIVVRINLLPLVAFSYSAVHLGPIITAVVLILIFVFPIFLISFFRRKFKPPGS
jgi:hypothetical protein